MNLFSVRIMLYDFNGKIKKWKIINKAIFQLQHLIQMSKPTSLAILFGVSDSPSLCLFFDSQTGRGSVSIDLKASLISKSTTAFISVKSSKQRSLFNSEVHCRAKK